MAKGNAGLTVIRRSFCASDMATFFAVRSDKGTRILNLLRAGASGSRTVFGPPVGRIR
jgi:hypothetical protein